jgi:hypothetical protein
VQKAHDLEGLPTQVGSAGRLRNLVLVRVACALRGTTKAEVAADLAPIAGRAQPAQWRAEIEREMATLLAAGLLTGTAARAQASDAGKAGAAKFLGLKGELPHVWSALRDQRLVAVALGMRSQPAARIKALGTPEGLSAAILESTFDLKIKGVATPARLREALAAVALKRAFGDKGKTDLAGKLGLSAKASRLLAAQLSREPRDFGTDTRLIAALASEQVGAKASDPAGVRAAVLRKFFGASVPPAAPKRPSRRALGKGAAAEPAHTTATATASASAATTPVPAAARTLPIPAAPPVQRRPDLPGFASEVRRHAASQAQGWSGDRKAYISHVWRNVREKRPEWGLSEIEFKCMLAEAHRAGQLLLANADLKDKDNIKDVQESAVTFRNTVFHFIRVDA